MTDFALTIVVRNVTQGDAESLAQDIYDAHAEELDADRGEFEIGVARQSEAGGTFDLGWEPVR